MQTFMRLWAERNRRTRNSSERAVLALFSIAAVLMLAPSLGAAETPAGENLLSIWAGARVIEFSSQHDKDKWSAARLIDDTSSVGWASAKGQTAEQVFVIELPAQTRFDRFEIDTAKANRPQGAAQQLRIEASASGATDSYQKIATTTLENRIDGQRIIPDDVVAARWLRIIVESNHGDPDYSYLMEVRGFGEREPPPPLDNLTGSYQSSYDVMHIRQEGAGISGCYSKGKATFSGGVDQRHLQVNWAHQNSTRKGPAIFAFNGDGSAFYGMWWEGEAAKTGYASGTLWAGEKVSDTPGDCPNFESGLQGQISSELQSGRSRIYGILFDLPSAQIRPDSETALRTIAESLKIQSQWVITIEGHTDAQGGALHNRTLSLQRAEAVKAWLVRAGIAESRLSTVGLGQEQPVASNDTPSGRAQNRRVELVRQ